jgi:hypothetical protein
MPGYTGYEAQLPSSSPMLSLQGTSWQRQYQDISTSMDYRDCMVTPKAADPSSMSSGMKMYPPIPSSSQTQNDFSRPISLSSGSGAVSATASRREESMQVQRSPPPLSTRTSMAITTSSRDSSLPSMTSTGSDMSPSTSSSNVVTLPVSSLPTVHSTGCTQQLPPPNFKTVLGVGFPTPISSSVPSSSNTPASANNCSCSVFNTWEHPPRILLVEDDEVARTLACKFLEKCGCEFVAVKDGMEAVNQMMLGCYDLVLMVSIIILVLPSA